MRILHLMDGKEKFTNDVVLMYNNHFNNGEHDICYICSNDKKIFSNPEIQLKQYEFILNNSIKGIAEAIKLIRLMNDYDYIVLHGIGVINSITLIYLFINRKFTRRHVIWIEWGYDLYDFNEDDRVTIERKIGYFIGRKVRNSVNSVIGIFPPDCEEYRRRFPNSSANVFYAPYIRQSSKKKILYDKTYCRLNLSKEKSEPVYIQIGHNGKKQLNHLETLKLLKKYSNENIKLFLPLNYGGDNEYVLQIKEYLEGNFKDKYIVLEDFMPRDEYLELLDRIDIAIINTQRQTALANIKQFIKNNVKMFMPKNSVMYDYFTSIGIPVFCVDEIPFMDFSQFTESVNWETVEGPGKYIEKMNDFNTRLSYWEKIYDTLRENLVKNKK